MRFLTAGAGARSPLAAPLREAGATLQTLDGWQVATHFGDPALERRICGESVGWADVSHRRKHEIQGDPAHLEGARPERGLWFRLTPERALLLDAMTPPEATGVHAIDITIQLAALSLAGPLARDLLARFCALDLRPETSPPGTLMPGSVARTPGYVLCETRDRYLVLFGAAYGEYIWTVVSDAGAHLGGRPVGLDALRAGELPVSA